MNILPFESNYIEIWGIKGKNPEKNQADKQNDNAKKINWFYTGVNKQLTQIDLLIKNRITMIAGTVTCFFVSSVKN